MTLPQANYAALKADINANTNTIPYGAGTPQIKDLPNNGDANLEIANWYNGQASPDYYAYRASVPVAEVMLNGFDWTRVDNLSVGKARIWEWITRANSSNTFDASKSNIRAGINETWKGTAADLLVRAAVYVHCTKFASRVEKLLKAAGNGTAPDGNGDGPATLSFEGILTGDDVSNARSS